MQPSAEVFALANQAAPPPVCWLIPDDGRDFCPDCAEKAAMGPHAAGKTYEVDGGWYGQIPSDLSRWCCACGRLLAYDLSDAGVAEEAAHFAASFIPPASEMTPDFAYQLVAVWVAQGRYPEAA